MRLSLSFQDAPINPPTNKGAERYREDVVERVTALLDSYQADSALVAAADLFNRAEPGNGNTELEQDALDEALDITKRWLDSYDWSIYRAYVNRVDANGTLELEQALFDRDTRLRIARAVATRLPSPHSERIARILDETAQAAITLTLRNAA